MTLASSIKQFVENIMVAARIVSPRFADYKVDGFDFYSESGQFDESFRSDVIKIIQDEIKIQMTTVGEDELKTNDKPLGSVDSQVASYVNKGVGIAQNPGALARSIFSKIPHTVLIALGISLIPIIIKELTRAGGLFDIRWKRELTKEFNGFLDRQTQKNTQLGIRGVRIQSTAGFIQLSGGSSGNSMRLQKDPSKELNRQDMIGTNAHRVLYDGL